MRIVAKTFVIRLKKYASETEIIEAIRTTLEELKVNSYTDEYVIQFMVDTVEPLPRNFP